MSGVLTTASTIACKHGATGTASSDAKLTVSNAKVLTSAGISGWSFVAVSCAQQKTTNTPSNQPCASMQKQSGGESQKLTAAGSPVVLDSISGTTNGQPDGGVQATAGQTKLTAS